MIDDSEKALIAAGIRATLDTMYNGLHSEDDHGYDLYKWLEARQEQIVQSACDKINVGQAMLVD